MEKETEETATKKVLQGRAALMSARPFYGCLIANVEPVPSRKFPTMATDGKKVFYNPEFVIGLTQAQVEFVLAHEIEHTARKHHVRRGGRDPKEWNICCDYSINPDLKSEGLKLIPNVYCEEKYRGLSAEDIYRTREIERAQQEAKQQQEQEQESSEGEDEDDPEDQDQDDTEEESEDDTNEGGDDQDEDEDTSEDNPPAGTEEDDNQSEKETPTEAAGEPGEGEPGEEGDAGNAPGEAPGEEDGSDGEGSSGEGSSEPGEDKPGVEPTSCGDPGGCGEVLDAAETAAEIAEADRNWDIIVRQGAALAKRRGDLPGYWSEIIKSENQSTQDWRETLRSFFDQGGLRRSSWSRPNRRFIGRGMIMPGSEKDGLNKVAFLIDTSLSMDTIALASIKDETQAALDDGAIDDIVVVYNDTRVTRVDEYHTGDEIEFDPKGRGGTDLRPAFEWIERNVDASMIVCFTDMEIGDPGPEPSAPVLFAAYGFPTKVREYLAHAPWGAPGIDVGVH